MAPAAVAAEADGEQESCLLHLLTPPAHAAASFPVVVIGLGMIGSAAARHLSQALGPSLLAIGPPEPSASAWGEHQGPFASHYDQGRLTRIADPDPVWASLAARSIARYPALELDSGVRFHFPVGSLRVSPYLDEPSDSLIQSFEVGASHGAHQELFDSSSLPLLSHLFPFFNFSKDRPAAVVERGAAGYINPRSLVSAQLAVAQHHGACIVRESVTQIVPSGDGVRVLTDAGNAFFAKRALVCSGAYSRFLIPGDRALDLRTYGRTVVLAEVDAAEEKRLAAMPTFIWRLRGNKLLKWVYGCPPVRYPDGTVALKVGGTTWEATEVGGSEADLAAWFRGGKGDASERAALEEALLQELMPGLRATRLLSKACAVSFTAHGRPYVDAADGFRSPSTARVFVAAGGCGAAAKSSDEIGRMAATLALGGQWTSDLDASLFRAVFKP